MASSSLEASENSSIDLTEYSPQTEESNQEEKNLSESIKITLKDVYKTKVSSDQLNSALNESFIESVKGNKLDEINLSQWIHSFAYFYQYGADRAGLIRRKVQQALQNCEDLYSRLSANSLKIVILGGGPGNDVIGLCSALCKVELNRREELNIIVTDLHPEWSSFMPKLEDLIKEGDFGDVSKLFRDCPISLTYFPAPSYSALESNRKCDTYDLEALENADLILMVKVLSRIPPKETERKKEFIKIIYEQMHKDAFLIVIDCLFEAIYLKDFECLYKDPYSGKKEHQYSSGTKSESLNANYSYNRHIDGIVVLRNQKKKKQEEKYFSELVHKTLAKVLNQKKISDDTVSKAIKDIQYSFTQYEFHKINLSEWKYSIGYFYRYGAHEVGLTRCKMLQALPNCEDLASKLKEPDLNIISLGGGFGKDVIGFCSALCEVKSNGRKHLKIAVTDFFPEWSFYWKIVMHFIKEGDYGSVSNLFQNNVIDLKFLPISLNSNFDTEDYFGALKNADVILMVKVFTHRIENSLQRQFVQTLYENMNEDAFLLFIDSPFDPNSDFWQGFEILYLDPYLGDRDYTYDSGPTSWRFDSDDNISSNTGIVVFRKKKSFCFMQKKKIFV